jgi:hypothetical protein
MSRNKKLLVNRVHEIAFILLYPNIYLKFFSVTMLKNLTQQYGVHL